MKKCSLSSRVTIGSVNSWTTTGRQLKPAPRGRARRGPERGWQQSWRDRKHASQHSDNSQCMPGTGPLVESDFRLVARVPGCFHPRRKVCIRSLPRRWNRRLHGSDTHGTNDDRGDCEKSSDHHWQPDREDRRHGHGHCSAHSPGASRCRARDPASRQRYGPRRCRSPPKQVDAEDVLKLMAMILTEVFEAAALTKAIVDRRGE